MFNSYKWGSSLAVNCTYTPRPKDLLPHKRPVRYYFPNLNASEAALDEEIGITLFNLRIFLKDHPEMSEPRYEDEIWASIERSDEEMLQQAYITYMKFAKERY